MSDDWGNRREVDDEDEKDEGGPGRQEPGGWPEDEPETGHFRSHWPDDDEPDESDESPSGWPTAGSTWQRPDYDDAPREWQRTDYGDYGYERRDELFTDAEAERYAARHSRDPLARLFPGLPRGVRVTLDWILTIAGAILIVLALKEWVVNPYRIPSSSMEPTLHCAKGRRIPAASATRATACSRAASVSTSDLRPAVTSSSSTRRRGSQANAAKAARS